jgi:hypothetical protein
MDKIDRSLTLSWPMLDSNLFFIRFRTEKERSPVFATGSARYSCVPASRGALGHGLYRQCLNPSLVLILRFLDGRRKGKCLRIARNDGKNSRSLLLYYYFLEFLCNDIYCTGAMLVEMRLYCRVVYSWRRMEATSVGVWRE